MMISAQVVETSLTTTDNNPSWDYTHLDNQTTLLQVTRGFKPFTVVLLFLSIKWLEMKLLMYGLSRLLKG